MEILLQEMEIPAEYAKKPWKSCCKAVDRAGQAC
jgi:hypothetical protein